MSTSNNPDRLAKGFTLVELVVFIVIVSIAMAGVLGVLNYTNRHSVDPLIQKQALAIAEALTQEIQQVPLTYCDPNDDNSGVATAYAGCATTTQQSLTGPSPSGESRYTQTNPFDNVADYGGFQMPAGACTGICRVGDSTSLNGLNGYRATVSLANVGGSAAFPGLAADAAIEITVTVTGPANTRVTLRGYRVRYAPRI
ncbi:MAG TPA: prepilin-type N-terminal cleavage/methylation domain-containing protein [Methylophilus sp.]